MSNPPLPLPSTPSNPNELLEQVDARLARIEARLARLDPLLERVTHPQTLAKLEATLDLLDAAPGLLAMLGDSFDELARQAQDRGLDLDAIVPELGRVIEAALDLLTNEQIRELLESDLLRSSAIESLSLAARAMANAQRVATPVSLFGALWAMREPEVQLAVGFAVDAARRFGSALAPSERPPALSSSKSHEHQS